MSSNKLVNCVVSSRWVARILEVEKADESFELDILTIFGKKKVIFYEEKSDKSRSLNLISGDLITIPPLQYACKALDRFEIASEDIEIVDRPQQWPFDTSKHLRFSGGRMLFHPGDESSISVIRIRHLLLKELRQAFWAGGYLEVETPIFEEWHSDTWITAIGDWPESKKTKWSVASEQYLATFLLQPIKKVFEIRHHFRPDPSDLLHQPEFTVLQGFWALAELSQVLSFVQVSLKKVIEHLQLEGESINSENALALKSPWVKDSFTGAHIRELHEELSTELWLDNIEIASFFPLVAPDNLDREILIDEVYAESRRYGMPSAVGFVIGIDRLVAALVGCSVPEVTVFEW